MTSHTHPPSCPPILTLALAMVLVWSSSLLKTLCVCVYWCLLLFVQTSVSLRLLDILFFFPFSHKNNIHCTKLQMVRLDDHFLLSRVSSADDLSPLCADKMPRRKPFSNKQKKQQMQEKRVRKKEKGEQSTLICCDSVLLSGACRRGARV